MPESEDIEARVAALEVRVEEVAADAAAARHLAAARDRDIADLALKVDANRAAINALGLQTRAGFDRVDERFARVDERFAQVDARFAQLEAKVDNGFAAMRHGFDQTAAGFARIAELIQRIDRRPDDR